MGVRKALNVAITNADLFISESLMSAPPIDVSSLARCHHSVIVASEVIMSRFRQYIGDLLS
jgi:hypothetical protein